MDEWLVHSRISEMKNVIKKYWKEIIVFAIIVLSTLLFQRQSWGIPLNRDEGTYAYIASNLFEKDFMPYRDAFDHKPPGIYLVYWLGFRALGESQYAIRFTSILASILGSFVFWLITRKLKVRNFDQALMTSSYVYFSNSILFDGFGSNTEVYMTTLLGISLLFYLNSTQGEKTRAVFLTGLFSSLALLMKHVAIFNLILFPISVYLFNRKHFSKFLRYFLLGAGIPIWVVVYWFLSKGAIYDFWEAVILFNINYVADGIKTLEDNKSILDFLFKYQWALRVLVVGFIINIVLILKKLKNPTVLLIFFWSIAYFIAAKFLVCPSMHYYYPLIQGIFLIFAIFFKKRTVKVVWAYMVLVILFSTIKLLTLPPKVLFTTINGSSGENAYLYKELGETIKENTDLNDTVFVTLFDQPQLLFYSSRKSPTRYLYSQAAKLSDYTNELNLAIDKKPRYVVAYDNWLTPEIKESLQKSYVKLPGSKVPTYKLK